MTLAYDCHACGSTHFILSEAGIRHLPHNLSKQEVAAFLNLASTIPSYEVITNGIPDLYEGTNEFIREVKIVQTLHEKFPNMDAYHTAEGLKDWLADRMQGSHQSIANALSRIQGDSAGEVDFVQEMQGSLRSLFTKTDFVRNADGRITSNYPGIDAVEINRLTGNVVQEYQVKTLRSTDSINDTLTDFLHNEHYKPTTTLVGPQELIDRARELGIPNPTKAIGTVQSNLESAEQLKDKILHGHMSVEMAPEEVIGKVIGGAGIGTAITITISALVGYMQYKSGSITLDELKTKIAQDGIKGAITGGALAGLSLFIPGGLIGYGIGFTVGVSLRRLLDEAFGRGMFGDVLELTKSVHANVELLHHGAVYLAQLSETNSHLLARSVSIVDDLHEDRLQAERIYQRLESKAGRHIPLGQNRSAASIFSRCDALQNRLKGRGRT